MKRFLTAAALTMLLATSAGAGTVVYNPNSTQNVTDTIVTKNLDVAGEHVGITDTVFPGADVKYVFTFTKPLKVSDIALSGTGKIANVKKVTVNGTNFTYIVNFGGTAFGGGSLPGGVFKIGDTMNIEWKSNDIKNPVGVSASFTTADVPVPATAALLPAAIVLLGLARKKK